jgi:hypothetical protein
MDGELLRTNTSLYDVMKSPPTLEIPMVNGSVLSSSSSAYSFPASCFIVVENVTDDSETAWCYLHGIGTKKNVKLAARYYRMAEKAGVKSVGLSWIWKEKYNEKEESVRDAIKGHRSLPVAANGGEEGGKKGKKLFGRKNSA